MNKFLFLLPFLLIMPLSSYASDQSFTLDQIFGHVMNFNLNDKLILINNDTNFSHSFNAINKDGYTRNTPSIFPQTSYRVQFEQLGNYSITDGYNPGNIGFINVINNQTITKTNLIFSYSNSTTITNVISLPTDISNPNGDANYWKSQALTWKFLAQQYYQQLQQYKQK